MCHVDDWTECVGQAILLTATQMMHLHWAVEVSSGALETINLPLGGPQDSLKRPSR